MVRTSVALAKSTFVFCSAKNPTLAMNGSYLESAYRSYMAQNDGRVSAEQLFPLVFGHDGLVFPANCQRPLVVSARLPIQIIGPGIAAPIVFGHGGIVGYNPIPLILAGGSKKNTGPEPVLTLTMTRYHQPAWC